MCIILCLWAQKSQKQHLLNSKSLFDGIDNAVFHSVSPGVTKKETHEGWDVPVTDYKSLAMQLSIRCDITFNCICTVDNILIIVWVLPPEGLCDC